LRNFIGKPKRKNQLGDLDVDAMKMDLKWGVKVWTGLNWLKIDFSGGLQA
jgi:hypothetical protein